MLTAVLGLLLGTTTALRAQGARVVFWQTSGQTVYSPAFNFNGYACGYGQVTSVDALHQHDYGTVAVDAPEGAPSSCNWDEYQYGFHGDITLVAGWNYINVTAFDGYGYDTQGISVYFDASSSPKVAVTPDSAKSFATVGGTMMFPFIVKNSRTGAHTFTLSVSCSGVVSCGGTQPSSVNLTGTDSAIVNVSYSVSGATAATGTLKLKAIETPDLTNHDSAIVFLQISPTGPATERSRCLSVPIGKDASYECGDLRIAHALPLVRTKNESKGPILTYNSQQAHPYPIVSIDATLPGGSATPDSVVTTLVIGSDTVRRKVSGSQFPAGQSRRALVAFDAIALATGVYDYSIEVRRFTFPTNAVLASGTGRLPIVNRSAGPFGAGWWMRDVEQLIALSSNRYLWIGGDGSVKQYEQMTTTATHVIYSARQLSYVDTLRKNSSNNTWSRNLPGGGTVNFDASLRHVTTKDQLGDSTVFTYDGSSRLTQVKVSPLSSGFTYILAYTGGGKLDSLTSPDTSLSTRRVTQVTIDGSGQLTHIQDPGLPSVTFAYHGSILGRVLSRTDRRGGIVSFGYDSAHRVASGSVKITSASAAVTTYCATQSMGMTACQPSLIASVDARTIIDGPRTDVTDVATFWTDELGGVAMMVNPFGDTTVVTHGDVRFPALVTRVRAPYNRRTVAIYDPRGNLLQSIDSGTSNTTPRVTNYEWDAKWNLPTKVTQPAGNFSRMAYNSSTGLLVWKEDGRGSSSRDSLLYDGYGLLRAIVRPGGARDSIYYDAVRQNVAQTASPLKKRAKVLTDSLGRVVKQRTMLNDTTDTAAELWLGYLHDRPQYQANWAPAYNNAPQQTYAVSLNPDAEGNILTHSVTRQTVISPPTFGMEWNTMATLAVYDTAGRKIYEFPHQRDSVKFFYDLASNDTMRVTRRGDTIFTKYDALNRVTRVIQATVRTDTFRLGGAAVNLAYGSNTPYGGLANLADTLRRDTTTFSYDKLGRLVGAANRNALIGRTYGPHGEMANDTLIIKSWARNSNHVYVTRYEYDANGRVTTIFYPDSLVPGTQGKAVYTYDAVSGLLSTVTGLQSETFGMSFNGRNELTQVSMPGSIVEGNEYDQDGFLKTHTILNNTPGSVEDRFANTWIDSTRFTYDQRGKILTMKNSKLLKDTMTVTYTGLGALMTHIYKVTTTGITGNGLTGELQEGFATDPSGTNRKVAELYTMTVPFGGVLGGSGWASSGSYREIDVDSATGQIKTQILGRTKQSFWYDKSGNTTLASQNRDTIYAVSYDDRVAYYDASGRVTDSERRWHISQDASWQGSYIIRVKESYRYDPLGRRVVVRTKNDCTTQPQPRYVDCDFGSMRRTVWSGMRELVEIQRPDSGAFNATVAQMESDVSTLSLPYWKIDPYPGMDPNPHYGRVAYVHGLGIDRPLSFTRFGYADRKSNNANSMFQWPTFTLVPHWNARGDAPTGTFSNGATRRDTTISGESERAVAVQWSLGSSAYSRLVKGSLAGWQGTLILSKIDGVGTYYRRNRQYDPMTGRFTQQDPIGFAGGLNLYGYANADPINNSDPTGQASCPNGWTLVDWYEDVEPYCYNPATEEVKENNFHYKEAVRRQQERSDKACSREQKDALKSFAADLVLMYGFVGNKVAQNVVGVVGFAIEKEDEPLRNYWPGFKTGTQINAVWDTCGK